MYNKIPTFCTVPPLASLKLESSFDDGSTVVLQDHYSEHQFSFRIIMKIKIWETKVTRLWVFHPEHGWEALWESGACKMRWVGMSFNSSRELVPFPDKACFSRYSTFGR